MIDEKVLGRIKDRVRRTIARQDNPYRRNRDMVTDLDAPPQAATVAALLDAKAAAAFLGVRVETLAQWRWRGDGPPFHRAGRAIRYRRDELDRWLKDA